MAAADAAPIASPTRERPGAAAAMLSHGEQRCRRLVADAERREVARLAELEAEQRGLATAEGRLQAAARLLRLDAGELFRAAVAVGRPHLVQAAARAAPDAIDVAAADGATPLIAAARGGSSLVVRELLAVGCCAESAADVHNWTGLHYAARAHDAEAVSMLLHSIPDQRRRAAEANRRVSDGGEAPLHLALRSPAGASLTCRALCSGGADVTRYAAGKSPVLLMLGHNWGVSLLRSQMEGVGAERLRRHLSALRRTDLSAGQRSALDSLLPAVPEAATSPRGAVLSPRRGSVSAAIRLTLSRPHTPSSASTAAAAIAESLGISADLVEVAASGGAETQARVRVGGPSSASLQWQLAKKLQAPSDPLAGKLSVSACSVEVPRAPLGSAAQLRAALLDTKDRAAELLAELPPEVAAPPLSTAPASSDAMLVRGAAGRMGTAWEVCGAALILAGVEQQSAAFACGFSRYIGQRLVSVDGTPVRCVGDVARLSDGKLSIRLTFVDDASALRQHDALASVRRCASLIVAACKDADDGGADVSSAAAVLVLARCAVAAKEAELGLLTARRAGVDISAAFTPCSELLSVTEPFVACVPPPVLPRSEVPTSPTSLGSRSGSALIRTGSPAQHRTRPKAPPTTPPPYSWRAQAESASEPQQASGADLKAARAALVREYGSLRGAFSALKGGRGDAKSVVAYGDFSAGLAQADCDIDAAAVATALGADVHGGLTLKSLLKLEGGDLSPTRPASGGWKSPPPRSPRGLEWLPAPEGKREAGAERRRRTAAALLRRFDFDADGALSDAEAAAALESIGQPITAEELSERRAAQGLTGPLSAADLVALFAADAELLDMFSATPPVGTVGTVRGLLNRTDLNGLDAQVLRYRDGGRTFQVSMGPGGPTRSFLRPQNLCWNPEADAVDVAGDEDDEDGGHGLVIEGGVVAAVVDGSPAASAGLTRFTGRQVTDERCAGGRWTIRFEQPTSDLTFTTGESVVVIGATRDGRTDGLVGVFAGYKHTDGTAVVAESGDAGARTERVERWQLHRWAAPGL
eukprot:TRINITY_DN5391_c0_g2_i1.p1 TRINITY_DN5391_c0_g2~~TRINITY_DN5391_c0_g2_i1.p1  ORF type:complete len:1056 (+),score=393.39 TRINITY_DN5391_c0_g2_i1:43-3168(+)